MGLFEKNRCRKFFQFIQDYDRNSTKTHFKGKITIINILIIL
jgi:RAB protein geranylgeranyltransferase component A